MFSAVEYFKTSEWKAVICRISDLSGVQIKLKPFLQSSSDFHAYRLSMPELAAKEQVHWNFTFIFFVWK